MSGATAGRTKIALITGANKGIGLETARQLQALGVVVLLGARDLAKGQAAAKTLGGGEEVRAIKLDVVNEADRKAAAEYIDREFGRLDILINNAGCCSTRGRRTRRVRHRWLCCGRPSRRISFPWWR